MLEILVLLNPVSPYDGCFDSSLYLLVRSLWIVRLCGDDMK